MTAANLRLVVGNIKELCIVSELCEDEVSLISRQWLGRYENRLYYRVWRVM